MAAPPSTGIPPIGATAPIQPMTAPAPGSVMTGAFTPGATTTLAPIGGLAQPISPAKPSSSRGKTIGLIIGGIVLVIAAFFAGRLTAPATTSAPPTPAPAATQPAFVVPGATQPAAPAPAPLPVPGVPDPNAPAPVPGVPDPNAPAPVPGVPDPNAPAPVPVNPGFIIPTTAP